MRARILFTDGSKTIDFFWVRHTGTDVYWGSTGSPDKRTYHASGKIHSTSHGGRKDETWHTPLRELKKQFHLTTLTFTNHSNWFTNSRLREYSGRKSDAVLVIDSRTIPHGVQVSVMVGLLEPGRLDIVQSLVMLPREVTDFIPLQPKQILISTAVEPWIYVVLHWIAPQHEGPANA
jgi:hypothetical protein